MKNALVMEHHFGDDGSVLEGMILRDLSTKRFDELEKKGLVREATEKEVRAGYKPAFKLDQSENEQGVSSVLEAAVDAARREVADLAKAEMDRQLAALRANFEASRVEHDETVKLHLATLNDAHAAEVSEAQQRASAAEAARDALNAEFERMKAEIKLPVEGSDKKAPEPNNKKAADPATKSA